MSTSQFTNQQIADYVSAVLGGTGTDAEKAAAINAAAAQYDVSRDEIAGATGYDLDVVNQYLGALPTTNVSADERQQFAIDSATVKPQDLGAPAAATAPTSSAEPATSPAVSNEDINKYIQGVLSSGVSQQEAANQINAAAAQYDVSRDEIAGATGYDLDVVNQYLGSLPAANASPLSTVSADKVLSNQGVTSQSPLSTAPVSQLGPTFQPTADVSLTPTGLGSVAPIGSKAFQQFTGQGGLGLEEMNRLITDYLGTSPTEVDVYKHMKQLGVSPEDIERATGKTLDMLYPEVFKPGSVLSSGFGDVTQQLAGTGYYKGVAIPRFYEQSLGDTGWLSVADQLAQWKANIDRQDLSINAPFGFVETPIYSPGSGDSDPYVSGYRSTPATAFDYLTQYNPVILSAVLGPTSTAANAYKIVNGELKEVGHDEITPEDITEGNAFFMLAGATGGPNRERMAQFYRAEGDNLIPVGDPKMYQGAKETNFGLAFLDMAASALAFVPGPWQVPAAIYKAGRAIDEGNWAQAAIAAIPVIGDIANAAAIASEAAQVAGAVESASFANDIVNAVSSVIPSLDSVGKVTNALQQSVSALKAIDDKNWLGLVASGAGFAGLTGVIDANTAGLIRSTANLANVLDNNGSPAQIIAAATSLANNQGFVDRATTDQVNAVASIIAAKDNPAALMGAVAQAARSGIFNETAKIGAQYEQLNSRGVVDEYNVTGGGGALITSGNPTEDQQIAIRQRQNAVNQALTDYVGPGNDLSREGLVSQLQSLGLTKDQAEGYAQQADQKINMDLVGADVRFKYSKIDPEFGTPQLDRDTAVRELVTAGYSSDRANEILNDVDAENASKLENRLNVQAAYNDLIRGTGTTDQLRSAMMLAGYTDAQINNQVTKGLGILEGSKLTPGEQAQERAANLPDIRAEIAGKSSFNEAYALAREKLGAGATFTWQGKDYVASSATERPDLTGTKTGASTSTATTDVPYIAPNGMHNRAAFIQAGGGTSDADYAKYVQAVNALVSEGKSGTLITPASVNSAGKELPSTKGPVTMEKPRVDSVLGSVAAQGVASFGANSIAGALSALGFTDAGRTVLDKANQIAAAATAAEGADITQGKKDINTAIQKVGESTGIKEFATNVGDLVSTAFKNPKAFGATVGSEVVEEVLQLATLKFPSSFLVKETVASAIENGGAAYNTEYESQIAKGASKEDAHLAAQKAAGTAAGVTVALAGGAAGLGKVAGKVIGSQADEAASGVSQVGKTTLRESAQEVLEEGSIAGSIDLALGRPIDAVNALTNMTGGALYGGVTAGSMQGTKLDTLDQAASTSIGSGVQASFNNTLAQTGDIVQASTGSVTTAINNGLNPGAAVSTVISTAAQSGSDMSAVITASIDTGLSTALSSGVDASEAVTTIVSGSITSSLSSGVDVTTAIDSTIGSSVKTGIANGADASTVVTSSVSSAVSTALQTGASASTVVTGAVSSAVSTALNNGASASTVVTGAVNSAVTSGLAAGANASTVIASSVTAAVSTATQSGADATAVVTGSTSTAVSTAIASGVDASTAVGSAVTAAIDAGANASVAAASSITAAIAAGTDINTAIAAATNANSNVTANSTTNNNVITTTATDTNTGVTTQTSVNTNTNTTTTTTKNNNVTTQVTTAGSTTTTVTSDVNTGLTTQTTVDTNTNTTTKITVNTNTDEVVVKVTDSSTGEVLDTQIKTVDELTPSEREKLTITDPTTKTPVTKPPVATAPTTSRAASLAGAMALPGMLIGEETPRLGGEMLKSEGDTTIKNPLEAYMERVEEMNRVDPALMAVMAQRLGIQLPEQSQEVKFPTFTYGQETSIDDILGLNQNPKEDKEEEKFAYAEGGYVEPLRAKPMNLQFMNRGGALPGGREDFKGGKHVAGDGDGQSDDIPAWLADGEFVFPADVVSALGNGSTKAGTDKLYKMMHEIRARARSTKVKDLPPPAHKSPLDYIKKGK